MEEEVARVFRGSGECSEAWKARWKEAGNESEVEVPLEAGVRKPDGIFLGRGVRAAKRFGTWLFVQI